MEIGPVQYLVRSRVTGTGPEANLNQIRGGVVGKQTAGLSQKAPLRSAPRVLIQMPPPLSRGPLVRRNIMRNSEGNGYHKKQEAGERVLFNSRAERFQRVSWFPRRFCRKAFLELGQRAVVRE